ncbi:MAG: hypothetical protein JO317_01340, partial [Verrucomicrobiae bacterium]|nr:hypothetical protein [Verrucomicrobiae bacterium]
MHSARIWGLAALAGLSGLTFGCGVGNPQMLYRQALEEESRGNLLQAQALFESAIARDPTYFQALIHSGRLFLRQNRKSEAEDRFRRAAAVSANAPDAVVPLAELLIERHELEGAGRLLGP